MRLKQVASGIWTVLAVCRSRGDCPLLDALGEVRGALEKDRDRMFRLLRWAAEQGPPKNPERCKKLDADVYEFRAGRFRVLWFYGGSKLVICSHLLLKSTQKTPRSEIDRANRERTRYLLAHDTDAIVIEE